MEWIFYIFSQDFLLILNLIYILFDIYLLPDLNQSLYIHFDYYLLSIIFWSLSGTGDSGSGTIAPGAVDSEFFPP